MKKEARRVAVNRETVDRDRGWRWGGMVTGGKLSSFWLCVGRLEPLVRVVLEINTAASIAQGKLTLLPMAREQCLNHYGGPLESI